MISSLGIVACFLTSFLATHIMKVNRFNQIEQTLKWQIITSTLLLTGFLYIAAALCCPSHFDMSPYAPTNPNYYIYHIAYPRRMQWHAWICSASGLWAGMVIGWFTEYMTSHSYKPVRDVAFSCTTGAATNIIYGLALGYMSTVVPIIALAFSAYISNKLLSMVHLFIF